MTKKKKVVKKVDLKKVDLMTADLTPEADTSKKTPVLEAKPVKEIKVEAPKVEVKEADVIKALQNELTSLKEEVEKNREMTIEEIREFNANRVQDVLEPTTTNVKNPSISNMKVVYTAKQYKALIEHYKKQNPAKYESKKVELERKLKELK